MSLFGNQLSVKTSTCQTKVARDGATSRLGTQHFKQRKEQGDIYNRRNQGKVPRGQKKQQKETSEQEKHERVSKDSNKETAKMQWMR